MMIPFRFTYVSQNGNATITCCLNGQVHGLGVNAASALLSYFEFLFNHYDITCFATNNKADFIFARH